MADSVPGSMPQNVQANAVDARVQQTFASQSAQVQQGQNQTGGGLINNLVNVVKTVVSNPNATIKGLALAALGWGAVESYADITDPAGGAPEQIVSWLQLGGIGFLAATVASPGFRDFVCHNAALLFEGKAASPCMG